MGLGPVSTNPQPASSTQRGSVEFMSLQPNRLTLQDQGRSGQLSVTLWFSDGSSASNVRNGVVPPGRKSLVGVQWSSSNTAVAMVDALGKVMPLSPGQTIITAQAGGSRVSVAVMVQAADPATVNDADAVGATTAGEIGGTGGVVAVGGNGGGGGVGGIATGGTGGSAGNAGATGRTYQKMPPPYPMASYAQEVVSFTQGTGVFVTTSDPDKVLGPPQGWGAFQGSGDVLSLGFDGVIVVGFKDYLIFDGPGIDFTVFENPFGDLVTWSFAEPGVVGVSNDGITFVEFPCDLSRWPYRGCAGVNPVFGNLTLTPPIDPTDPTVSGGDFFDLADVGLQTARYIRIRDRTAYRQNGTGPTINGFDLDAVAIVNGTLP
ncbi:MAG: Ig-like domain-containing protein, partial [Deltaproteobacteria bacterium]|nr:Ig-like domain-containing protein [Deltaproteobacteria bacterium]